MAKQNNYDAYLQKKQKNNRILSYGEWVTTQIEQPQLADASTLKKVQDAFAKGLPSFGQSGERLGRAGLSGSGYSQRKEKENAQALAVASEMAQEQDNEAFFDGYAAYVKQYESKQQKAKSQVFSTLRSGKYTDQKQAYALALSLGLNEENAKEVAKQATQYNQTRQSDERAELRRAVLDNLVKNNLTAQAGYTYALQCGLSEEEALAVAQAAEKVYYAKRSGNSSTSFAQEYEKLEQQMYEVYQTAPYNYYS